ncbi:DUF1127 domain-containing protein [Planktotalea sp.]|uniref:DUF1127 domain-containing protein n=1 Tax=Planktotalea sp. TaxID=2029877 RepID=UPI0025D7A1B3|nr:DUF1127 domain-containing protein [Planktotalea sp.]
MAFLTDTFSAQTTFADKLSAIWARLLEAQAKRAVYSSTVHELSALSSRELRDLGIHRSMIRSIAHEAAYKG